MWLQWGAWLSGNEGIQSRGAGSKKAHQANYTGLGGREGMGKADHVRVNSAVRSGQ